MVKLKKNLNLNRTYRNTDVATLPDGAYLYLIEYNPETNRYHNVIWNNADNHGDAYNKLAWQAFGSGYDAIIECNDDVVFNPWTYELLMEDVASLDPSETGWVCVRSDNIRSTQNIKFIDKDEMFETWVVSPILGYISKEAWIDYLPLNDFGDDVQCMDMTAKGLKHYVSRAYAHHVGSHTLKTVGNPHYGRDRERLKELRPEYYKGF